MSFVCGVRKILLQGGAQAMEKICCATNTDNAFAIAFPAKVTKVAVINVDTAGRELLLSGQEGICVQWR
jgi:hypothetical protein